MSYYSNSYPTVLINPFDNDYIDVTHEEESSRLVHHNTTISLQRIPVDLVNTYLYTTLLPQHHNALRQRSAPSPIDTPQFPSHHSLFTFEHHSNLSNVQFEYHTFNNQVIPPQHAPPSSPVQSIPHNDNYHSFDSTIPKEPQHNDENENTDPSSQNNDIVAQLYSALDIPALSTPIFNQISSRLPPSTRLQAQPSQLEQNGFSSNPRTNSNLARTPTRPSFQLQSTSSHNSSNSLRTQVSEDWVEFSNNHPRIIQILHLLYNYRISYNINPDSTHFNFPTSFNSPSSLTKSPTLPPFQFHNWYYPNYVFSRPTIGMPKFTFTPTSRQLQMYFKSNPINPSFLPGLTCNQQVQAGLSLRNISQPNQPNQPNQPRNILSHYLKYQTVECIGIITKVNVLQDKVIYCIDDGSGPLNCIIWTTTRLLEMYEQDLKKMTRYSKDNLMTAQPTRSNWLHMSDKQDGSQVESTLTMASHNDPQFKQLYALQRRHYDKFAGAISTAIPTILIHNGPKSENPHFDIDPNWAAGGMTLDKTANQPSPNSFYSSAKLNSGKGAPLFTPTSTSSLLFPVGTVVRVVGSLEERWLDRNVFVELKVQFMHPMIFLPPFQSNSSQTVKRRQKHTFTFDTESAIQMNKPVAEVDKNQPRIDQSTVNPLTEQLDDFSLSPQQHIEDRTQPAALQENPAHKLVKQFLTLVFSSTALQTPPTRSFRTFPTSLSRKTAGIEQNDSKFTHLPATQDRPTTRRPNISPNVDYFELLFPNHPKSQHFDLNPNQAQSHFITPPAPQEQNGHKTPSLQTQPPTQLRTHQSSNQSRQKAHFKIKIDHMAPLSFQQSPIYKRLSAILGKRFKRIYGSFQDEPHFLPSLSLPHLANSVDWSLVHKNFDLALNYDVGSATVWRYEQKRGKRGKDYNYRTARTFGNSLKPKQPGAIHWFARLLNVSGDESKDTTTTVLPEPYQHPFLVPQLHTQPSSSQPTSSFTTSTTKVLKTKAKITSKFKQSANEMALKKLLNGDDDDSDGDGDGDDDNDDDDDDNDDNNNDSFIDDDDHDDLSAISDDFSAFTPFSESRDINGYNDPTNGQQRIARTNHSNWKFQRQYASAISSTRLPPSPLNIDGELPHDSCAKQQNSNASKPLATFLQFLFHPVHLNTSHQSLSASNESQASNSQSVSEWSKSLLTLFILQSIQHQQLLNAISASQGPLQTSNKSVPYDVQSSAQNIQQTTIFPTLIELITPQAPPPSSNSSAPSPTSPFEHLRMTTPGQIKSYIQSLCYCTTLPPDFHLFIANTTQCRASSSTPISSPCQQHNLCSNCGFPLSHSDQQLSTTARNNLQHPTTLLQSSSISALWLIHSIKTVSTPCSPSQTETFLSLQPHYALQPPRHSNLNDIDASSQSQSQFTNHRTQSQSQFNTTLPNPFASYSPDIPIPPPSKPAFVQISHPIFDLLSDFKSVLTPHALALTMLLALHFTALTNLSFQFNTSHLAQSEGESRTQLTTSNKSQKFAAQEEENNHTPTPNGEFTMNDEDKAIPTKKSGYIYDNTSTPPPRNNAPKYTSILQLEAQLGQERKERKLQSKVRSKFVADYIEFFQHQQLESLLHPNTNNATDMNKGEVTNAICTCFLCSLLRFYQTHSHLFHSPHLSTQQPSNLDSEQQTDPLQQSQQNSFTLELPTIFSSLSAHNLSVISVLLHQASKSLHHFFALPAPAKKSSTEQDRSSAISSPLPTLLLPPTASLTQLKTPYTFFTNNRPILINFTLFTHLLLSTSLKDPLLDHHRNSHSSTLDSPNQTLQRSTLFNKPNLYQRSNAQLSSQSASMLDILGFDIVTHHQLPPTSVQPPSNTAIPTTATATTTTVKNSSDHQFLMRSLKSIQSVHISFQQLGHSIISHLTSIYDKFLLHIQLFSPRQHHVHRRAHDNVNLTLYHLQHPYEYILSYFPQVVLNPSCNPQRQTIQQMHAFDHSQDSFPDPKAQMHQVSTNSLLKSGPDLDTTQFGHLFESITTTPATSTSLSLTGQQTEPQFDQVQTPPTLTSLQQSCPPDCELPYIPYLDPEAHTSVKHLYMQFFGAFSLSSFYFFTKIIMLLQSSGVVFLFTGKDARGGDNPHNNNKTKDFDSSLYPAQFHCLCFFDDDIYIAINPAHSLGQEIH